MLRKVLATVSSAIGGKGFEAYLNDVQARSGDDAPGYDEAQKDYLDVLRTRSGLLGM